MSLVAFIGCSDGKTPTLGVEQGADPTAPIGFADTGSAWAPATFDVTVGAGDTGSGPSGPTPESDVSQGTGSETAGSIDAGLPSGPCETGDVKACYEGPDGTRNVGRCGDGFRTCTEGLWGPCEGQILPRDEWLGANVGVCTNGDDDDCDGYIDEDFDSDGDGFGACSSDCCDLYEQGCGDLMAQINPGAFEIPDNGLDDDCDGQIDNALDEGCSLDNVTSNTSAEALVRAMDLCRFVEGDDPGWGVLEASLSLADGSGQPEDVQVGVLKALGGVIPALFEETMAVISTGTARGVGDPDFQGDNTFQVGSTSTLPSNYLSVHGKLQSRAGCPPGNLTVWDSVRLRVRLRSPSNATGFRFRFRFFSHEYPSFLCTEYNDFMLVLVDGQSSTIPADGNVSYDATGAPISVNNAFFTTCESIECFDSFVYPVQSGPDADGDGCVDTLECNTENYLCEGALGACPDGSDALAAFTTNVNAAGATAWLQTQVPLVPGEELTIDFHVWDTSDSGLDSLVLLDGFEWTFDSLGGVSTHR